MTARPRALAAARGPGEGGPRRATIRVTSGAARDRIRRMENADLVELREAKRLLENPGLAIDLANAVGQPIEWALARLPERAARVVATSTRTALDKALGVALSTLDARAARAPRDWRHRAAVWASGAAGGAFGLAGLPLELPVSTTLMLRSIAENARAQGEDLGDPEARLNCLLVFALGGRSRADDAAEAGYFAVRVAFARTVAEAAEYVAGRVAAKQAAERSAPALVRLLAGIAGRFGMAVQQKLLAQLVPVVGAAGGALVNEVFMRHFQDTARGHFTVRRLERRYGTEDVRRAYAGP